MDEELHGTCDTQSQLDEMSARLARSEADIEVLQRRAGQASRRARVDERQFEEESRRVDRLEGRTEVDHRIILELQAKGLVAREHAAHLEAALQTSRRIGAAVGIVMAFYAVPEARAFEILERASEEAGHPLAVLADRVVATGNVTVLRSGRAVPAAVGPRRGGPDLTGGASSGDEGARRVAR